MLKKDFINKNIQHETGFYALIICLYCDECANGCTNKCQGNSGFGTQTPQAKMHVVSTSTITTPNVLVERTGTDYARLMFKNFPSSAGSWTIAEGLSFWG